MGSSRVQRPNFRTHKRRGTPVPIVRSSDDPRSPPHNVEAEQSVLGAILVDNGALAAAATVLSADDFYRDGHRRLFLAMQRLIAQGHTVDFVLLHDELRRRD